MTLHPYIYRKFMEFCPDRRLRWNCYQAHESRGRKASGEAHYYYVGSQVKELRQHRQDVASTLGYASFADLSMDTKMASNTENVHTMIASLLARGKSSICAIVIATMYL